MISLSIAPGFRFAGIPDSAIFWRRPVVNKSTICVLVTRELSKQLTTLLVLPPFFEPPPLLMDV
jgi:hypothetical protein